jgi:hypothetical protein
MPVRRWTEKNSGHTAEEIARCATGREQLRNYEYFDTLFAGTQKPGCSQAGRQMADSGLSAVLQYICCAGVFCTRTNIVTP